MPSCKLIQYHVRAQSISAAVRWALPHCTTATSSSTSSHNLLFLKLCMARCRISAMTFQLLDSKTLAFLLSSGKIKTVIQTARGGFRQSVSQNEFLSRAGRWQHGSRELCKYLRRMRPGKSRAALLADPKTSRFLRFDANFTGNTL